jgi:hypothetical protein
MRFCFFSKYSEDVTYAKTDGSSKENTQTGGFPYINRVINEIAEKYRFAQPEIFLCIKISFLLPVEETLDLHAEEFLSFVQVKSFFLFVFVPIVVYVWGVYGSSKVMRVVCSE